MATVAAAFDAAGRRCEAGRFWMLGTGRAVEGDGAGRLRGEAAIDDDISPYPPGESRRGGGGFARS